MAKTSGLIGQNLIDYYIPISESPSLGKNGEESTFASWDPNTNYWNVTNSSTTFANNQNVDSFLNEYNSQLKNTISTVINDYDSLTRNYILDNNFFNYRVSGNSVTSSSPEAGATANASGNPQQTLQATSGETKANTSIEKIDFRYPKNTSKEFDYLQITVYDYVPPGVGLNFQGGGLTAGSFFSPESTESRITKKIGSIVLPMQPGISESNSVSWGSDQLNPVQTFFGGAAANAIKDLGGLNIFSGLETFVDTMIGGANEAANNPELKNYLVNYFAGKSVGANIATRSTGLVINPNLELLFTGPNLRSFSYNYKLTPRDSDESSEIKKLILLLKKSMAPKKNQNLFLKTPYVFKLKYIFGKTNGLHPFLNKIKMCALTSLNVDYTPDGNYMTYQDGSMTSYNLSLAFSELEPIYEDDYPENDSSTMGY